jgi:hypothetical protein
MLPSSAITCSRDTASELPTMSRILVGRYFSTCSGAACGGVSGTGPASGERRRRGGSKAAHPWQIALVLC